MDETDPSFTPLISELKNKYGGVSFSNFTAMILEKGSFKKFIFHLIWKQKVSLELHTRIHYEISFNASLRTKGITEMSFNEKLWPEHALEALHQPVRLLRRALHRHRQG